LTAVSTHAVQPYGPSAIGGSVRRFVELTLTLARTDFKLRYFGSVLGYAWSLMRPLLFFGVIYVVFTQIFSFGNGVPHYGVYLLTGIVLWTFFGEATSGSVQSLVQREALLRKVRFPRMVVPLSVSLTALFNLAMNFIAVIVFALANGIKPQLSWLWLFPIIIGFVILATGAGMLLSALYVRYRDVLPIWEVAVQMMFYAAPVMYVASKYQSFEHVAMLSPFAMMLTQMGHSFIDPTHNPPLCDHLSAQQITNTIACHHLPTAAHAAGGTIRLLIPIAIIFGTFALGWWFFTREAPRVAENL
jgi:ABC-2 type transport system permease protein